MKRRPPPSPIIQRNTGDRTGTAGILRSAAAAINRRFAALLRDVRATFDRIPVYRLNLETDAPRVRYGLTPEQLAAVSQELQAALDRWIAEGRETGHVAWFEPYIAQAHQLGAAQAAANLAHISEVYAAARSLESIVFSEPYRVRVAMAQTRSYEHWTRLAAELRGDLAGVIGRAVVDGTNPRAAAKLIAKRLGVSRGRALGYAQTDITGALREARMAEADDAAEALGLRIGLLWTSAFLPTTRPTHAARHGRAYTSAEVKEFYGRDGNRFRCHCSITEVELDANGRPILADKTRKALAGELATWRKGRKD